MPLSHAFKYVETVINSCSFLLGRVSICATGTLLLQCLFHEWLRNRNGLRNAHFTPTIVILCMGEYCIYSIVMCTRSSLPEIKNAMPLVVHLPVFHRNKQNTVMIICFLLEKRKFIAPEAQQVRHHSLSLSEEAPYHYRLPRASNLPFADHGSLIA